MSMYVYLELQKEFRRETESNECVDQDHNADETIAIMGASAAVNFPIQSFGWLHIFQGYN
eukprot:1566707-Ditylum_brightwellii.AAC.1